MSLIGAGDETQTRGLFLGKEALYQLSYTRILTYIIPDLVTPPRATLRSISSHARCKNLRVLVMTELSSLQIPVLVWVSPKNHIDFGGSSQGDLAVHFITCSMQASARVRHDRTVCSADPSSRLGISKKSYRFWWLLPDSNWGHKALQASALPTELKSHMIV